MRDDEARTSDKQMKLGKPAFESREHYAFKWKQNLICDFMIKQKTFVFIL